MPSVQAVQGELVWNLQKVNSWKKPVKQM